MHAHARPPIFPMQCLHEYDAKLTVGPKKLLIPEVSNSCQIGTILPMVVSWVYITAALVKLFGKMPFYPLEFAIMWEENGPLFLSTLDSSITHFILPQKCDCFGLHNGFLLTFLFLGSLTVDGLVKCERWIRDDDNQMEESTATWWLNRLIGRTKKILMDWPYPFIEGKLFVLTLSAGLEGYRVDVDGRHVTSFPYRTVSFSCKCPTWCCMES